MSRSPILDYIVTNQAVLLQKDFHIEIFMNPDRLTATNPQINGTKGTFRIETLSPLYKGKLFVSDTYFYAIDTFERIDDRLGSSKTYSVTATLTYIPYMREETQPLCTPQDRLTLNAGEIANYPEGGQLSTTLGRFIANYLFLVWPFGDTIPYLEEEFSASKLESRISAVLLAGKVSTQDVKDKYVNALSLFGQSNEVICPNISEKTISIPPYINELRERLVAENKEALEAGDASVMSDIEKKLISAYKEYLKGDPSLHFLLKSKHFNVALKKLLLIQGMTEIFGSPGKFTFITQPMGSGWKLNDLVAIFNEVRQGSYSRAIETADGGVIAKLILRVFQDTQISIPDCGTTIGSEVNGTKDQMKDYLWNYVINTDGSTTLITAENLEDFVGKNLLIRTPGFCKSQQGFCARCMGHLFENLGQKAFAPVANEFARVQTTNALKAMHGKSHSTVDVSDLNQYLI